MRKSYLKIKVNVLDIAEINNAIFALSIIADGLKGFAKISAKASNGPSTGAKSLKESNKKAETAANIAEKIIIEATKTASDISAEIEVHAAEIVTVITADDLRDKIRSLIEVKGYKTAAKAGLTKLGATSISNLAPEKYGDFMDVLNAIG